MAGGTIRVTLAYGRDREAGGMTGEPEPVNALEVAIAEVLEGGGDAQRVLSLLWTSAVLISKGDDSDHPDALNLTTIEDEEGKLYLPVYTSPERMAEALPEGADYVAIRLSDLADGWPEGVSVAVNPGTERGFEAELPEVRLAAETSGAADAEILVGEPADEPSGALADLADVLRSEPGVRRAFRAQFLDPRVSFEPQLAIGLEVEPGTDERELFQRLLARSGEQVEFDRPVAFIPVREDGDEPIAGYMRERDEPFYVAAGGDESAT
jgi:hypothetical protein